jgi:hypothetical protein
LDQRRSLSLEFPSCGLSFPYLKDKHRLMVPITVAARSEAWTVCARSNTGIVGSNSTHGMDVCAVLCRLRPCDGLIPRPRRLIDCV